jgi:hypothetical protein
MIGVNKKNFFNMKMFTFQNQNPINFLLLVFLSNFYFSSLQVFVKPRKSLNILSPNIFPSNLDLKSNPLLFKKIAKLVFKLYM